MGAYGKRRLFILGLGGLITAITFIVVVYFMYLPSNTESPSVLVDYRAGAWSQKNTSFTNTWSGINFILPLDSPLEVSSLVGETQGRMLELYVPQFTFAGLTEADAVESLIIDFMLHAESDDVRSVMLYYRDFTKYHETTWDYYSADYYADILGNTWSVDEVFICGLQWQHSVYEDVQYNTHYYVRELQRDILAIISVNVSVDAPEGAEQLILTNFSVGG